jgi:hypothetical protein
MDEIYRCQARIMLAPVTLEDLRAILRAGPATTIQPVQPTGLQALEIALSILAFAQSQEMVHLCLIQPLILPKTWVSISSQKTASSITDTSCARL